MLRSTGLLVLLFRACIYMIPIAVLPPIVLALSPLGLFPAAAQDLSGADRPSLRAAEIDIGAMASFVAKHSARVQPGELVWIEGGSADVEFMERLAVAVGAEGGLPIVTLYSGEFVRRWYQEVPERFDSQRDEWLWQMYEKADVVIRMQSIDSSVYAEIPPERLAATDAANAGVFDLQTARGIRVVRIGNGLYPSEERARVLGIDRVELERIFRAGMMTDPAELAASGQRVQEILHRASTVRVQHPNGTDITVAIGGGRIVVSDGATSLAPHSTDQPDHLNVTWLPGGEVTLGLDPNLADGRLVVERVFLDGEAIGPFTLTYANGRLQGVESDADLSRLRGYVDSAVPLSEQLTGLKFGLNPHITDPRVLPWMGAGMFSFSMGGNRILGGEIDLPFMFFLTLAGATVHVDGQAVVRDGVLAAAGLSAVVRDGGNRSDYRPPASLLPSPSGRDVAPHGHASPPADLGAIATGIARNAAVREGELVWIDGAAGDVEFMERLAVAVAAEGGLPLVSVFSDAALRRWYEEVPERFDSQRDEWRWQMHQKADVAIFFGGFDPATLDQIHAGRLRAYNAANQGMSGLLHERGVRVTWVGNGSIHPSEWSAAMFGIGLAELEPIYWKGLATDPRQLAPAGNRLSEILSDASIVRIRHPNGTDITVGVGSGRIVVSDGTTPIGDDTTSALRGGPGTTGVLNQTWLPAGEVTLAVDPERADGRLVLERLFLRGRDIGPVTLSFADGRLQAIESESDLSDLRDLSQSALPMSERLTGLKFGLNPDMTDPRVLPFMGAGNVSLSMGTNIDLGGEIDLPFMFFLTLVGATVHVDGQVVVRDGVLTVPARNR